MFVQKYRPCSSFGAHNHTMFGAFFELLAQVWQFMVSTTKEVSEKCYIGAHRQSRGYKEPVEFYSQATSKWSKSMAHFFPRDFKKNTKFSQIPRKIVAPLNDKLRVDANIWKSRCMLWKTPKKSVNKWRRYAYSNNRTSEPAATAWQTN